MTAKTDTTRARPTRADETATQRRRRADFVDYGFRPRLFVDHAALDHQNFTYRWLNDEPGRVKMLTTADDWDLVTQEEAGGPVEYASGLKTDGTGQLMTRLVKKPKKFHVADQRAKIARLDADTAAMLEAPPAVAGQDNSTIYTRAGVNQITDGYSRVTGQAEPPLAE